MRRSGVKDSLQYRQRRWKRKMALLLAVSLSCFGGMTATAEENGDTSGMKLSEKYTGFEGIPVDWEYGSGESAAYYRYETENASIPDAAAAIEIPLSSLVTENGSAVVESYEGRDAVFSVKDSKYLEFSVNIPSTANYQIEVDYYLASNNSDAGKRALYIDNAYPFTESGDIVFDRYFMDDGEPKINSLGDETRPAQVPIAGWRTTRLSDTSGTYNEPFVFALDVGSHTIRLTYMKMDMYISAIRLVPPARIKTYEEVKREYEANGYRNASGETVEFQAELTAVEKNDPTLRRENDGDPLVYPESQTVRRLNVMGGYRWRSGNQSITWEFEVPEDGLYKIGLYVKQMWNDGLPSYRQVAIDGEVPFQELLQYKFDYDTKWTFQTLSDEEGTPFEFYLTKGTHYLTMTVKMGEIAPLLNSIRSDITLLSDILLNITLLAGSEPDPNYDYRFFSSIPNLEQDMRTLAESMAAKYDMVAGFADKTPAMANNFLTIQSQLEKMIKDPFIIAKQVGDLTSAQESLSNWFLSLQEQPLVIDYFKVGSPDEKWESKSSNFFQRIGATFGQFVNSFFKDYDNVGSVLGDDVEVHTTINVWIARGTEWAEVIKEMADESFTPETGIAINVNVLPASQLNAGNVNALMLSITSGKAPDVALGVDITSPVEFAIRDQVYDLSQFDGFDEVKNNFVEATLTPYEYMGGTFALPETMNFNVMFYRRDLMSQMAIDLPETRQQLYDYVLPVLYQNGLDFYFAREFTQFLYQNGGSYYTEDGMQSALDTPEAYRAFKEYTELFTNYGVPETANFYQYMRSGVMPLGIGDYNTYMQLSVAAPEIAGKWGIAPIPGVLLEDGSIDRTAGAITDKGDIIMKQSEYPEQSWEFLKWWSSTEIQTRFAREVEALMGAEARWNSANKEAFLSLSWSDDELEVFQEMWKWARETPTVLGGYMTTRHMTNAWTTVVISGGDVREALEQAVKDINRELRTKQEEYGIIGDE